LADAWGLTKKSLLENLVTIQHIEIELGEVRAMIDKSSQGYQDTLQRIQAEPRAQLALATLAERGSLAHLSAEGFQQLTAALILWLLQAESHEGSEIVYRTEDDKVRGMPIGSYFDFPDYYDQRMPHGAFLSAELEDGMSVVLYLENTARERVLEMLEAAQRTLPFHASRPLREQILDKLQAHGHLSYLSKEGLDRLQPKLLKYLDYAVNTRAGSEIIYFTSEGAIKSEGLEEVFKRPEAFAEVLRPVYLAIEVGTRSVVFDTQDLSPANLWRLKKKAEKIVAQQAE